MLLQKFDPVSYFEIWHPRYHDNKVLLKAAKVGEHNKVAFTKSQSMGEEPYYVSGKTIKKYPKEDNGKIQCFAVPISELQPLEINQKDMRMLI